MNSIVQMDKQIVDGSSKTAKVPQVFIGGIPLTSTRAELMSFLERFGPVSSLEIPVDKRTGKLKGYAKAQLESRKDLEKLLADKDLTIRGLAVGVKLWTCKADYLKKKDEASSRKIFVRHHPKLTETQLYEFFSSFGEIELFDYKVCPKTGRSRNFLYIIFSNEESACRAVLHGSNTLDGKYVRSEVTTPCYLITKARKYPPKKTSLAEWDVLGCKETRSTLVELPLDKSNLCKSIVLDVPSQKDVQPKNELPEKNAKERNLEVYLRSGQTPTSTGLAKSRENKMKSKQTKRSKNSLNLEKKAVNPIYQLNKLENDHQTKPTSSNYQRSLEANHRRENLIFSQPKRIVLEGTIRRTQQAGAVYGMEYNQQDGYHNNVTI